MHFLFLYDIMILVKEMNYYIELQGTCWLVQYLNYCYTDYNSELFFRFLALNRYIRYKKAIELIKSKKIFNRKYLLEMLLSFEGSLFDIDDINCYEIIGKINENLCYDDIFLLNEKVLMLLLQMYDNNAENEIEIFKLLYNTFENLKFNISFKNKINIVIKDSKLSFKKIKLINSDDIYFTEKYLYNVKDIIRLIDDEIKNNGKVLVSIDNNKALISHNIMLYPENIKKDTLIDLITINNHYYVITEKVVNKEGIFYKAFTGYKDDEYILISYKYLIEFINCVLCDKICINESDNLDFYNYMEE